MSEYRFSEFQADKLVIGSALADLITKYSAENIAYVIRYHFPTIEQAFATLDAEEIRQ
jgi:hypothetical protein